MIPLELWQQKFEQVHGPGEIMLGSDMSNEEAMKYALVIRGQYTCDCLVIWGQLRI